jgi:hypothetical protein
MCFTCKKPWWKKTQSVLVHLYLWEICVYSCPLGFKAPQRSKCGNHTLSPVVVVEIHDDDNATIMHINRYVLHSFTHRILQNDNVTRDFLPERATCFLFATDR